MILFFAFFSYFLLVSCLSSSPGVRVIKNCDNKICFVVRCFIARFLEREPRSRGCRRGGSRGGTLQSNLQPFGLLDLRYMLGKG